MKPLIPVILLLVVAGGLLYVFVLRDEDGEGPEDDTHAPIERAGAAPVNEMNAAPAEAVGVLGEGRLPDPSDDPNAWRDVRFEAPEGTGPITGQVLLDVVSEHIAIRFVSAAEMGAFRKHQFLPKPPDDANRHRLGEFPEWVRRAGYLAEDQGGYILLRKEPGPEKEASDG